MNTPKLCFLGIAAWAALSPAFAAAPGTGTISLRLIYAEPPGKRGDPLPDAAQQIGLPFDCKGKITFPQVTLTRIDLPSQPQMLITTSDANAIIAAGQTSVQQMFKKLPSLASLQKVSRSNMEKQTLTVEMTQPAATKFYQPQLTKTLGDIVNDPALAALIVLDGKNPDRQWKAALTTALLAKIKSDSGSALIESPPGLSAALDLVTQNLCSKVGADKTIAVFFSDKTKLPPPPPPPKQSAPVAQQVPVKQPPRPPQPVTQTCYYLFGKKLCISDD